MVLKIRDYDISYHLTVISFESARYLHIRGFLVVSRDSYSRLTSRIYRDTTYDSGRKFTPNDIPFAKGQ